MTPVSIGRALLMPRMMLTDGETGVPALIVVLPVYVLAPVRVRVPAPPPVPELLEKSTSESPEILKMLSAPPVVPPVVVAKVVEGVNVVERGVAAGHDEADGGERGQF